MSAIGKPQNMIELASNSLTIGYIDGAKFQEVVESVTNQVCKLLNAEAAGVMLYDDKKQELVLQKPAFGGKNDKKISVFRVPIDGQGIGISVFRTGIPCISNDAASDPRISRLLFETYPTRNLISFPLEYKSRRIGVLHVNNKKTGDFTQEDLELLGLVSSHLTLLLENSAHYESEKKHNAELKASNQELAEQRERQQRLMEIHSKLVKSILNGEGLAVIITTLAELLNCVVVVEDKHLNVVCSAKEGLEQEDKALELQETLKSIVKKGIMQQYFMEASTQKKITFIPPLPEEEINYHRVLVPLTDQSGMLGYLSVLYNDKNLDEFDKVAIEQTALIASLELEKEKNIYEIETKLRGELLDELLEGTYQDPERIFFRARYFSYDFSVPQAVAVVRINSGDYEDGFAALKKIKSRAVFLANKLFPQSLIVEKRNDVIILIPQQDLEKNYFGKLECISNEIQKNFVNANLIIGVGKFYGEISRIRESYRQAKRVLDVLQKFDFQQRVLSYDNLGIFNLLYNVNDAAILKLFVEERIGALLAYDQNNCKSLVPTLECYLRKGSIKDAAEELYIHVNTMKYKLKKIEDLLNVDLKSYEKSLELSVALMIHKVLLN